MSKIKTEAEIAARLARRSGKATPPNGDALPGQDPEFETDHEMDTPQDTGAVFDEEPNFEEEPSFGDEDQPAYDHQAEIENLRHELKSIRNRVVPSQRQAEEYRRQYEEERLRREQLEREQNDEINRLRAQLDEQRNKVDVIELLDEEELMMFDPSQLTAITKLASEISKRSIPQVDVQAEVDKALREQAKKEIEQHRLRVLNEPSRGLSRLYDLQSDPKFMAWADAEGNEDFNVLMTSFLTASDKTTVDRLARRVSDRLRDFEGTSKPRNKTTRQADPRDTRVARAMDRDPRRLGQNQVQAKLAEAKRLARSRNPQDREKAQRILSEIDNI